MLSLLASWLELHIFLNPEENEYIFGAWGLPNKLGGLLNT